MGIPFSIYGQKQVFMNHGDPNVSAGEYDPYRESSDYRRMYHLFEGLHRTITPEQRGVVEAELGVHDGIGRLEMAWVLYGSFVRWVVGRVAGGLRGRIG